MPSPGTLVTLAAGAAAVAALTTISLQESRTSVPVFSTCAADFFELSLSLGLVLPREPADKLLAESRLEQCSFALERWFKGNVVDCIVVSHGNV